MARIAALGDGGFERLNRGEAAAEHLAGGADALDTNCGAHVLPREVGVEDFGDFVPGGFVGAGDVVKVVALDEEVVEDGVEVGGHGENPEGAEGQRGKGNERKPGGEVSRCRGVEVSRGEDAKKRGALQRGRKALLAQNNRK